MPRVPVRQSPAVGNALMQAGAVLGNIGIGIAEADRRVKLRQDAASRIADEREFEGTLGTLYNRALDSSGFRTDEDVQRFYTMVDDEATKLMGQKKYNLRESREVANSILSALADKFKSKAAQQGRATQKQIISSHLETRLGEIAAPLAQAPNDYRGAAAAWERVIERDGITLNDFDRAETLRNGMALIGRSAFEGFMGVEDYSAARGVLNDFDLGIDTEIASARRLAEATNTITGLRAQAAAKELELKEVELENARFRGETARINAETARLEAKRKAEGKLTPQEEQALEEGRLRMVDLEGSIKEREARVGQINASRDNLLSQIAHRESGGEDDKGLYGNSRLGRLANIRETSRKALVEDPTNVEAFTSWVSSISDGRVKDEFGRFSNPTPEDVRLGRSLGIDLNNLGTPEVQQQYDNIIERLSSPAPDPVEAPEPIEPPDPVVQETVKKFAATETPEEGSISEIAVSGVKMFGMVDKVTGFTPAWKRAIHGTFPLHWFASDDYGEQATQYHEMWKDTMRALVNASRVSQRFPDAERQYLVDQFSALEVSPFDNPEAIQDRLTGLDGNLRRRYVALYNTVEAVERGERTVGPERLQADKEQMREIKFILNILGVPAEVKSPQEARGMRKMGLLQPGDHVTFNGQIVPILPE